MWIDAGAVTAKAWPPAGVNASFMSRAAMVEECVAVPGSTSTTETMSAMVVLAARVTVKVEPNSTWVGTVPQVGRGPRM
jgi:hypothetical protein